MKQKEQYPNFRKFYCKKCNRYFIDVDNPRFDFIICIICGEKCKVKWE